MLGRLRPAALDPSCAAARRCRPWPSRPSWRSSPRSPGYADWLAGDMRANIEQAVRDGPRRLPAPGRAGPRQRPADPAAAGARRRLRARPRRGARAAAPMDALLAAYRVGARVAWRELSARAGRRKACSRRDVAEFAELVFAYIDELSAASVAGHADEHATTGRVRERYLERLGAAAAGRGVRGRRWPRPPSVPDWDAAGDADRRPRPRRPRERARSGLDARTLRSLRDLAEGLIGDGDVVLLVPDAGGRARARAAARARRRQAVVGPARPWQRSPRRAGARCAPETVIT